MKTEGALTLSSLTATLTQQTKSTVHNEKYLLLPLSRKSNVGEYSDFQVIERVSKVLAVEKFKFLLDP